MKPLFRSSERRKKQGILGLGGTVRVHGGATLRGVMLTAENDGLLVISRVMMGWPVREYVFGFLFSQQSKGIPLGEALTKLDTK